MARVSVIKKHKPTTPGSRGKVSIHFGYTAKEPTFPELCIAKAKVTGRGSNGRITSGNRGGGHKRRYRVIDFKRSHVGVPGKVVALEYDPNRNAAIAAISYIDGKRAYIIAPQHLKVGDTVESGLNAPITIANALPITNIPVGTVVHNVELNPGQGGKLARSAGTSVQILGKEVNYVIVRLKSGETRKILLQCMATIGTVSNPQHNLTKLGKAGAKRWKGFRPRSRGVAQNPVDHPMGGGEGRTSGGRHQVSPTGVAKGTRTRSNRRTEKLRVKRRSERRKGK